MIKEAFGTAPTVDAALDIACQELGLERSEVEFEIIDNPVKKKFGLFGGNPAKVRAYIEIPDEPEATPAEAARDYLLSIFKEMEITGVDIDIEETENGAILTLRGDDLSCLIGRRGETLDSLQYLAGLIANRVNNNYYRITIDSGNFREKRENTLRALAKRIAVSSVKTGRAQSLEPMNPYERRIIHTTVHNVKGALSWSMGEDLTRHVVIGPEEKGEGYDAPRVNFNSQKRSGYQKKQGQRGNNKGPRGSYQRRDNKGGYRPKQSGQRPRNQRSAQRPSSAPAAGTPTKKDTAAPLYGRVEPKAKQ
ncbi:MAG: protein jag [Clostridia bacterium]|nr:protein jag [Clostridia bacterium]